MEKLLRNKTPSLLYALRVVVVTYKRFRYFCFLSQSQRRTSGRHQPGAEL